MAIQISGTTVIDNSRNLSNIANSTNANTANAFVVRDGSGNFSAGTITASLNGSVTLSTSNGFGTRTIQSGGTASGGSNGDIYYIY